MLSAMKSLSDMENEIWQLENATFSLFLTLFEKIVKSAKFWIPIFLELLKFWSWNFQDFQISFTEADLQSTSVDLLLSWHGMTQIRLLCSFLYFRSIYVVQKSKNFEKKRIKSVLVSNKCEQEALLNFIQIVIIMITVHRRFFTPT